MRPTAAYGDEVIPVDLYVLGRAQPAANGPLPAGLSMWRFVSGDPPSRPEQFAPSLPKGTFCYTLVQARAPAREFAHDLRFTPVLGLRFEYARLLMALDRREVAVPAAVLLIAILSYVSAGLCGLLFYGRWGRYAVIGLTSLLTFVGLFIALVLIAPPRMHRVTDVMRVLPFKVLFVAAFAVLFSILAWVVVALVSAPL